jgi:hypothetical protein
MFFGGRFSHAVRKSAMLDGPYEGVDGLFRAEEISAWQATPEQLDVAGRALRAAPGDPLYARVDLVPGPDGPLLLELELTEPSLFLGRAPGAAGRFADAVAAHLEVVRSR